MGMSPAPSIANFYVAIHEAQAIIDSFDSNIFYLWRFIDDGLAIWLHDPDSSVNALNFAIAGRAIPLDKPLIWLWML